VLYFELQQQAPGQNNCGVSPLFLDVYSMLTRFRSEGLVTLQAAELSITKIQKVFRITMLSSIMEIDAGSG
jgi:hypothetical protein